MYEVKNTKFKRGILVLVEGFNDVEFLRRMSRVLHTYDAASADLDDLEQAGQLVFVPFGGGGLHHWSHRLGPLGWKEFHLYDREVPPDTEIRQQAAKAVNARTGCRAVVMTKLALENYLHPQAIRQAKGVSIAFSDMDSVADLVARHSIPASCRWDDLSLRAQKRLRYHAKKWLNRDAVDRMTPALLAEQDPAGELVSWLGAISELARAC